MSLLDHFHPPISRRRSWEGFQGLWAAALVEKLNQEVLSDEFYADMQVHIGSRVEVDVAALDEAETSQSSGNGSATSTMKISVWTPPKAALTIPAVFPDDIEVQIYRTTTGAALVGAIELVSPGNKDRPEARTAFTSKCVGYLTHGIGLIVVDIVTNRRANLHNEILTQLHVAESHLMPPPAEIYAVAYRPSRQIEGDQIEVWSETLTLGKPMPLLPLGLLNAGIIPIDLDTTYNEACQRSKLA